MKAKFTLPVWLTDPERVWQRVAAGLALLVLILFVICCRQQVEKSKYLANIQELTKLNDSQRKMIGQIGEGLGQVMVRLDQTVREQKQVAEEQEKLSETPETPAPAVEEAPASAQAPAPAAAKTLEADLNGDGIVDWDDFELFSQDWGKSGPGLAADLNHDNQVDWQDFQVLTNQWMKTEAWYAGKDNFTSQDQYADRHPVR